MSVTTELERREEQLEAARVEELTAEGEAADMRQRHKLLDGRRRILEEDMARWKR